jgi:DNA-binding MurR/RpiR family transcriptional regulator
MTSGLALLKEIRSSCTDSELTIADFLINNPKTALLCTISELAVQAGGNPSAAMRLCKRAGLSGYRELQLMLAKDVYAQGDSQADDPAPPIELDSSLSVEAVAEAVVSKTREALERSLALLKPEAVERAARAILAARSVAVFGAGASANVAYDFFQKLTRIGIVANFSFDADIQISSACGLSPDDLAVAFSYSGRTASTLASASEAKRSGATLVSVTGVGPNPLERRADLALYVPRTEPLLRTGASLSRTTQLALVDVLFTTVVCRSIDRSLPRLERSMRAVHALQDKDYDNGGSDERPRKAPAGAPRGRRTV